MPLKSSSHIVIKTSNKKKAIILLIVFLLFIPSTIWSFKEKVFEYLERFNYFNYFNNYLIKGIFDIYRENIFLSKWFWYFFFSGKERGDWFEKGRAWEVSQATERD